MERHLDAARWYGEPNLSDVTIRFSGMERRAHKIILSMRSRYFERAFAEDKGFKESKEAVLELHGDDATALDRMLRYIYTSVYPISAETPGWQQHLELAIVADKYGLLFLKDVALERLENTHLVSGTAEALNFIVRVGSEFPGKTERIERLVERHCDVCFKECFRDARFRNMLKSNGEFRDRLCLRHVGELIDLPEFEAMLEDERKLAVKLLKAVVKPRG